MPNIGALAVPVCLINSVHLPAQAQMRVTYPPCSVVVKVLKAWVRWVALAGKRAPQAS